MVFKALCWTDIFVYEQCCDTASYGHSGLELCFAKEPLTFQNCCPFPTEQAFQRDSEYARQVEYISTWEGEERHGCDSRFFWLPSAIASAIQAGPAYHPRSGDVLEGNLALNSSQVAGAVSASVAEYLKRHKDLTLRSFVRLAQSFFASLARPLPVELAQMMLEIVIRFADVMILCPEAAVLGAILRAETVFLHSIAQGSRYAQSIRVFTWRAMRNGYLDVPHRWGGREAMDRLEDLASGSRPPLEPVTVDFVLPLCGEADVAGAASSLALALRSADGGGHPSDATLRRRDGRDHVAFALHLYDVCGLLSADRHRNLTAEVVGSLSTRSLGLLGAGPAGGQPRVIVDSLSEDVPAGDVGAYFHHLAKVSTRGTFADMTLLLHADFMEHIRPLAMDTLVTSLVSGSWPANDVDFMYLGWRHEGPTRQGGSRVAGTVRYHCGAGEDGRLGGCFRHPAQVLAKDASFGDFSPTVLENLWSLVFRCPFDARVHDFGGYDFSQLLLSRRAVEARPSSFWRRLSRELFSAKAYQLLPGVKFVSRRVDLSPRYGFNKGVSIWFEHMWHLLFDPSFFPEGGSGRDLRSYTRLANPWLPPGVRLSYLGLPDSVMMRHYWLPAAVQCLLLRDRQGCHLARLEQAGATADAPIYRMSEPLEP